MISEAWRAPLAGGEGNYIGDARRRLRKCRRPSSAIGSDAPRTLLSLLVALVSAGCLTARNAAGVPNYQQDRVDRAIDEVAFLYPECPRAEIRLGRVAPDGRLAELSVCGVGRGYQDISPDLAGGPGAYSTWVDVTAATAH